MNEPFSLLIKPASADCNLRCEYCFYLDRCELYPESTVHRMSEEALETMVSSYMATNQPQYAFGWQGGEPTLMGLPFFEKVIELQKKHGRPGSFVANGLQTNATLIDDDFAKHFAKYHYLLGISLDGPAEIHDRYRNNAAGRGSHADVLRGIEACKRHGAEFNILVLVSQANVHRVKEVYRYLVDLGFFYHQYIPCVEFDEKGNVLPFSINGEEWGGFLCGLYDEWYQSDTRKVSIRYFDSLLSYQVDGIRNICHMGYNCCQYFVVEHNGDIYPCDFFVRRDLRIGNVMENNWDEALKSSEYHAFGRQKRQWVEACDNCEYVAYCAGDCLKHRLLTPASSAKTLSVLCEGHKEFFEHTLPGLRKLADVIKKERALHAAQEAASRQRPAAPAPAGPVGRNEPCPCGSGKKYKKCCGMQALG